MSNLEALQSVIGEAFQSKERLAQRRAEFTQDWAMTNKLVKDAWEKLDLAPAQFKIDSELYTCSKTGIDYDNPEACNINALSNLNGQIIEFLQKTIASWDMEYI